MRAVVHITVDFDDSMQATEAERKHVLLNAVEHLAANGLLSADDDIIDCWSVSIDFSG